MTEQTKELLIESLKSQLLIEKAAINTLKEGSIYIDNIYLMTKAKIAEIERQLKELEK